MSMEERSRGEKKEFRIAEYIKFLQVSGMKQAA